MKIFKRIYIFKKSILSTKFQTNVFFAVEPQVNMYH